MRTHQCLRKRGIDFILAGNKYLKAELKVDLKLPIQLPKKTNFK